MAKIEEGNIKLASSICRTGAHPLDDSAVVNTIADLYDFSDALYEGMSVVVNADHSIYVLTDVSKAGTAAGWKKIGDVSSDITRLQSQIDKLNGAETTDGSVKKIAKAYADAAGESAREYANGLKRITGIGLDDNILTLDDHNDISATVALGYEKSAKRIVLLGRDNSLLSSIDASSFIKDGMLDGATLYTATAATGKVTINSKEYSLSGLTANNTYIVLVWNTDAAKDAMAIDVTTLINNGVTSLGGKTGAIIVDTIGETGNNKIKVQLHTDTLTVAGVVHPRLKATVSGYGTIATRDADEFVQMTRADVINNTGYIATKDGGFKAVDSTTSTFSGVDSGGLYIGLTKENDKITSGFVISPSGVDNQLLFTSRKDEASGVELTGLATPTRASSAATKSYVDKSLASKVDCSEAGLSKAINTLSTGTATPEDADYFISQYAGGGTTHTTIIGVHSQPYGLG